MKTCLLALALSASAAFAQPAQPAGLSSEQLKNFILTWYQHTNDHHPVEELFGMMSDDVEFYYPDSPKPFTGKQSFQDWYANALKTYFDETHYVENWKDITIDGNKATVQLVVRWEYRTWKPGDAVSKYHANLAHQRLEISRSPDDGRLLIRKKAVEKFEVAAPIFGVGN
ncbi:MAG: hypothetical protein WCS65_08285 [Verrucomicrobiae bacterium]